MDILTLLDELTEEIEHSSHLLFSYKKAVDPDVILEIISDIKKTLPEDMIEAENILKNKEDILISAREQADNIMAEAETRLEEMVDEHEVSQKAYQKAKELMDSTQKNAKEIRLGAKSYADDVLSDLQGYLEDYLEIVRKNRKELNTPKKAAPSE